MIVIMCTILKEYCLEYLYKVTIWQILGRSFD
jgi:hypothetical protein